MQSTLRQDRLDLLKKVHINVEIGKKYFFINLCCGACIAQKVNGAFCLPFYSIFV